jgi:hypothetical protein
VSETLAPIPLCLGGGLRGGLPIYVSKTTGLDHAAWCARITRGRRAATRDPSRFGLRDAAKLSRLLPVRLNVFRFQRDMVQNVHNITTSEYEKVYCAIVNSLRKSAKNCSAPVIVNGS